jgi:predicted nucleotidyltransferase
MNDVALKRMAIALPMDEIAAFCRRWGISEFALFGSVLLLTFRPDADPAPDRERMRRELEALFRRPVDVTYRRVIEGDRNYIIRRAILESAQVVYAA